MAHAKVQGKLKHGVMVGDEKQFDFELRESITADLFDAEVEADPERQLAFRGALLGQQLVRLGSLSGPFGLVVIRKLHRDDFALLCAKQDEVDALGKAAPGG